jgi:hypothetical protein
VSDTGSPEPLVKLSIISSESRSKMKNELIGDKTMLKDAVSQLVSYHQDVEAILSEVLITQRNLILKSCICESVTV